MEHFQEIIKETLKEINVFSKDDQLDIESTCQSILQVFERHCNLINFIESNADEILEINKIKKDKTYLKKYISAFKQNQTFYKIIEDLHNADKMNYNILIFEIFIEDTEAFYRLQSSIYALFLSSPDAIDAYGKLKRKNNLNERETKFVKNYEGYRYIKSILKFFRCYALTKKNILTSLSIVIYKALILTDDVKKHQAKNILETMFSKLDIPTTIQLDKIKDVYIKTVVDKTPIYAYPNSNNRPSFYNFDEINQKLSDKLEKNKNNPSKSRKFEHYINNKISPLHTKLGL